MKIKEIIAMLELVQNKNKNVYFDFCGCIPTSIASWGIYDEPAIGWESTGYSSKTVDDLLKELKHAISGVEYIGWKSGKFAYTGNEVLHVDNPGNCSNTEIIAVTELSYCVVLLTHNVLCD